VVDGQVSYRITTGCVPRRSASNRNNITGTILTEGLIANNTAATPAVHFTYVQLPTLRAAGYFCVGFDEADTACVNALETRSAQLNAAFESLPGVFEVRVTLIGEFNTRKNYGSHVVGTYDIEFLVPQGANVPQLQVISGYVPLLTPSEFACNNQSPTNSTLSLSLTIPPLLVCDVAALGGHFRQQQCSPTPQTHKVT
jgi:hypothetical protein